MPQRTSSNETKLPEVWLVGGYGDVGTKTAGHLLALSNATIVLAGRDHDIARRTAQALGPRVRGERLDITQPDACDRLRTASAVVSLTEALPVDLAGELVRLGVTFIDTSADQKYTRQLGAGLDAVIRPSGGYVVGAGLVPGLSNILAADIVSNAPSTDRIDVVVEVSLGRHHGRQGTAWTLANLAGTYISTIDGIPTEVATGKLARSIRFGDDTRVLSAVGYGFADQTMIASDHELSSARTFLTLNPAFAASLLSRTAGTAVGRFVADHATQFARLASCLPTLGGSGTRLAIEGFERDRTPTRRIHLVSEHDQAELTATMVAAITTRLLGEQQRRGHIRVHQLLDRAAAATVIAQLAPRTRLST